MIEIYTARLSEIRNKEKYLLETAGRQRKEKALRFLQADDRLRCLAAGYLLKQHLPGYSEEMLRTGKEGKPFLPGGPAFSISHGGDFVVLAVDGSSEGIGVDVEPIREMEYYKTILPYAMTDTEKRTVGEDAKCAVRIWTRKESLYKCVGEGVSDFLELPEVLEDQVFFFGKLCRLHSWEREGHMFSVASRGSLETVDQEEGFVL